MNESLLLAMMLINISADFLDKKSSRKTNSYAMALWTNSFQFLLLLPLIGMVHMMPVPQMAICFLVALFTAYGRLLWYKALSFQKESLSRLTPFTRFSSVVVLIAAFTLFHEPFSGIKASGGILMVIGTVVIGFEKFNGSIKQLFINNKAAGYVIVFAASSASIAILYKYLLNESLTILTVYFFLKAFQMAVFVFHSLYTNKFRGSFANIKDLRVFVVARILQTVAAFIYIFVIQGSTLSTVAPLAALNPLMVTLVEYLLKKYMRFRKKEVGAEEAEEYHVGIRVTALVLVSLGAIMLYYKG
jgi:drug/metabolite transporter (DMT)-like permease